ncbi:hypothetical protein FB451DRAFT_1177508 [Mycena latifolia]|nr:hypothetical protein FB451DRAFT_1177508 [Mycena latifolia]
MRFTSSTAAALFLLFSLSSTALAQSELEARDGRDDGRHRKDDDCIPFFFDNVCVKGRCQQLRKCELGFSLDPIRLCCVHDRYRRGGDGYGDDGYGRGGKDDGYGRGGKGGGYGGDKDKHGKGKDGHNDGGKDHGKDKDHDKGDRDHDHGKGGYGY